MPDLPDTVDRLQAARAAADIAFLDDTLDARNAARARAEQFAWALARHVSDPLNEHAEAELADRRAEFEEADQAYKTTLTAAKGKRTRALNDALAEEQAGPAGAKKK